MSLVFDAGHGAALRQTHALVIGVADYLHLSGGSRFAAAPANNSFGLPRLDSPHVSAISVANLLRTLSNRQAPIGTIDVVLSPPAYINPQGQQSAVELATMNNITKAFGTWSKRAHANPENVAIFFFCGHGFEKDVMILLPADFGDPQVANIALNMIDFTTSRYNNLRECDAKTQVYLVDACRENPIDLMRLNVNPTALISTLKTRQPPRDSPVLQSANSGMKAHGAPGQPSYFSRALADCFQKFGAHGQNGGVWEVNTDSLGTAMKHYMPRMKVPGVPPLTCDATGQSNFASLLHSFAGPAYVMSLIDCDPRAALSAAQLSVHDGVKAPQLRQGMADPWELDLAAGQYDVSATFATPPYQNRSFKQLMQPPHTPCTLDVL